ncbi:hypothetical protein [Haloarcula amylovorans]|uniref:hypothetical protein n=1 Tax=Haloarcula amylovorans TaxID=2562280 RepID=UPI001075F265|nr:hypothetical protein [Halomicroarcula amylolytica]
MSFYRVDADFVEETVEIPDDSELTGAYPSRLQIATSDTYHELLLSREDFDSVLTAIEMAVEETEIKPQVSIEDGLFTIDKAPLGADESYSLEIKRSGLESDVLVSVNELSGLYELLKEVHPDRESDGHENLASEIDR